MIGDFKYFIITFLYVKVNLNGIKNKTNTFRFVL